MAAMDPPSLFLQLFFLLLGKTFFRCCSLLSFAAAITVHFFSGPLAIAQISIFPGGEEEEEGTAGMEIGHNPDFLSSANPSLARFRPLRRFVYQRV